MPNCSAKPAPSAIDRNTRPNLSCTEFTAFPTGNSSASRSSVLYWQHPRKRKILKILFLVPRRSAVLTRKRTESGLNNYRPI